MTGCRQAGMYWRSAAKAHSGLSVFNAWLVPRPPHRGLKSHFCETNPIGPRPSSAVRDWAMAAIPFEGHPRRRDQRDLSPYRLRIRSAVRQLSFPVSRPARGLVRLALRGIRKGRRHRFKGRLRRQVRIEGQRT